MPVCQVTHIGMLCFDLFQDINPDHVRSQLSADGVLSIYAPRPEMTEAAPGRDVPIEMVPNQRESGEH